jgi:hypothetical protein
MVPAGGDLILDVTLKDGRATLRRVSELGTLKSTLEALMTVLPADSPVPTSSPTPAPPVVSLAATQPSPSPNPTAPRAQPTSFGVEVGAGLGGRVAGAPYVSIAPNLLAQIRVGHWLLGMQARWEFFQTKLGSKPEGFEMQTVGAGLSVGRRVESTIGSFDFGISPGLLAETQTYSTAQRIEFSDTQTDVRLGLYAKLAFGHGGGFRPFLVFDADLSPVRIRREIRLANELPPLAAWSLGSSLGVVWGDP